MTDDAELPPLVAIVFSPAERRIARLLLEGFQNIDVARLTGMPLRTLNGHLKTMCRKAGLRRGVDRVQLVVAILGKSQRLA